MEKERISVIIPAHNVEAYLERCMDSVLGQTYHELEIILVENGSIDRTPELCDAYARRDSRVRVVHLEIGDVSTARNAGVQQSTASYITFVDSDDYLVPTMCEILMDRLKQCTDADMAFCSFSLVYEDGREVEQSIFRQSKKEVYTGMEMLRLGLLQKTTWIPCARIYRKKIVEAVPFPEGYMHEDYFTSLLWFENCRSVVYTPEILYYYWQRSDSASHTMTVKSRYHSILMTYKKWDYGKWKQILSAKEQKEFANIMLLHGYLHYKRALRDSAVQQLYKSEIADMRQKIRTMFREDWSKLSFKTLITMFISTDSGQWLYAGYCRIRGRKSS
ncbi:glycosyltransferase family 2 protein [Bacteroides sp. AN502(2024)]|uniref:glycosyltransferase family 2 protein n=1 Tax=Bacteroides sp. AN502(2024) TaxID=3160599 RepID=UPI003518CB82